MFSWYLHNLEIILAVAPNWIWFRYELSLPNPHFLLLICLCIWWPLCILNKWDHSPQLCSSAPSEHSWMPLQCAVAGRQVWLEHWKPLHRVPSGTHTMMLQLTEKHCCHDCSSLVPQLPVLSNVCEKTYSTRSILMAVESSFRGWYPFHS